MKIASPAQMDVAKLAHCGGALATTVSCSGLPGTVELVGMRQLLDTAAENNRNPSYWARPDSQQVPIDLATLVTRLAE